MKWRPNSLKSKLTLSIFVIASVSVMATVISNLTLGGVSQTVADLASENLSVTATSARFAEIGQEIRVDTPRLGSATTQYGRQEALNNLEGHFRDLKQLSDELAIYAPELTEKLTGLLDALMSNVEKLDANVAGKFTMRDDLGRQVARINRLHSDFLLEVDPLLIDANFNVTSAIDRSFATPGQEIQADAVINEVRFTEALGRLHAACNLIVGLMLRAVGEDDFGAIEQLRLRLLESITEANENLPALQQNSSSITLLQIWREIASYGDSPRDLLELKLRETALRRQNTQLQNESAILLEALGGLVADTVRESGQRTESVSLQIKQEVRNGQLFGVLAGVATVVLLILFSVFFIRGQLLQRLMRVLSSMQIIADGNFAHRVLVDGKDEIGQLADAVRLFRHKSQELETHAEVLQETNSELRHEIALRHQAEQDLRETQAELLQAAKLAALGQLSASIAHEFNQPLAALSSYNHNAELYLERGEIEKCREKLEDIDRLVKRLSKTSNHLKSFARRPQEAVTRHSAVEVLENALSLFDERVTRGNIKLVRDYPEGPVHVLTDPAKLEQVLVNLISNAIDAVENQETPTLHLVISETDRRAIISVVDNGTGFAQEVSDKLFEPFFTTKPPGKGLGLGLSISFNIIRDLGGRLQVLPGTGDQGGTTATVELFKT
ncbi:ATP-binding protein [Thalassospira sp. SM2505]|uniref:C4-dicarboxylate transport sensor protein DctB n=1 Tax=Thalassospira profundimaris TaxID=502049 RepID=A0A367X608_9PROT|nr:ATP-binding protein [Thalassospira profundimaris]RCK48909.1 histidine kinase [Thalassospira profundimaris]